MSSDQPSPVSVSPSSGALIDGDWSAVTVTAPEDGETLTGDGWSLDMAEGWRLAPGERDGDFVLQAAE